MTFTLITHQLTLFDYNAMRPKLKVPTKKITKARAEKAMAEMRRGNKTPMVSMLRNLNDDLEKYCKRKGI